MGEIVDETAAVTKDSALPYMWMLCGSVSFATMGALAHALGRSCPWQVIALARTALPLLFVTPLALAAGARLVFLRPRTLWLRSIAGSLSMMATFFAITHLPVSDVFTLTNTFPIWVAVLSWPLLGEPPAPGVWLAVAAGMGGVVLIQQPHLAAGHLAITWLALGSSVCTAFAMIGLHRLQGIDARAIVVHFSGVALLFCVACFFLFEREAFAAEVLGPRTILLLLGVGVAATVGQLFLTKAFAAGSPAKVSVVGLSQIPFALLLDVALFDHGFNVVTLLGMALVLTPTAWLLLRGLAGPRDEADAVNLD
jgi:drug/metabolite transporter (DMT)-like permease